MLRHNDQSHTTLKAVPLLSLLVAGLSFHVRPAHVGFIVEKVLLAQVRNQVFRFIIAPMLHTH
jgi:hypothetical protein